MDNEEIIKVLLVEDDEDDFVIARDLLGEIRGKKFSLEWASTYEKGLELMPLNQHDVCLVDYRLGPHNGVELLRAAIELGCQSPVILLTTSGHQEIDMEAMEAGAADYLVKSRLEATWLERSIRYAIQRKRLASLAAFEQARLAAFGAEVGLALTRRGSLTAILNNCTKAMAQYLNAELAQIFTYDIQRKILEQRSSAGPLHENCPNPRQLPLMNLNPLQVADGKPVIIRQLTGMEPMANQEWIIRANLAGYAAFPLVLEEKLIGLMSIFSRAPLTEQIAQEMSSVANGIALYIDRKRSEEALGVSESKYRSVVESIKEVIFQLDTSGNWTFLNPAWSAITGIDVKQSLGKSFLDFIHDDDRESNRQIFQSLVDGKESYSRHETRLLTKEGNVRWAEVDVQTNISRDGHIVGASGSISDITERHLAEMRIQQLAAFPRVNPNPVLELSAAGTLTYANDAAREMAKSLEQNELFAIMPPDAVAIARNCLETGQKALRNEIVINGRTVMWAFFPVPANQVVHCYGTDVTDVLSLEAQLRQSQKMECVGQLAAGVAHDINNVLTVVQGRVGLLLAKMPGDSDISRSLKQISTASERAARFIHQLLTFSRKQIIQTKVLDLNIVLHNLEGMLSRLLGEDISFETVCAREIPCIEADTGMIEQVVMNLAVNARDAMPKGGKLTITTGALEVDGTYTSQHAGSRPGKFVSFSVKDTGCGMDAKTLDRIFEPFFTTKAVGKGTGLGLATVYGIVRQHGGWVDVQSEVDVGTTFTIILPASTNKRASNTDFISKNEVVEGGRERILIVEDEIGLREMVREILDCYHYDVLMAASGPEAIQLWKSERGRFDLIVTDMIMPGGMTGLELAQELKKLKPDLKVVFTSGYTSDFLGRDLSQDGTFFLPKPYRPPQLAMLVRQCLDGKEEKTGQPLAA